MSKKADYLSIIKEAIERARRVKAPVSEYKEGLEEWIQEIENEIEAVEVSDG